jgi:hypothetical protein
MADSVHVGYSEVRIAMAGKQAPRRPWANAGRSTGPKGADVAKGIAALAQRANRPDLAPIEGRAPDSPWDGTNVGAEIARQRAAIIAASRMN